MRVHLIPAAGLSVLDPATRQALPPEGLELELDTYWRRRVIDGDVRAQAPAAPEPTPQPAPEVAPPTAPEHPEPKRRKSK